MKLPQTEAEEMLSDHKERCNVPKDSLWKRGTVTFCKKLLQIFAVLLVVSFLTFLLTYLAPGEPGMAMYEAAGIIPTEEMLAQTRERLGLDKPFMVQYTTWIGNCLHGDFGESFALKEEVVVLLTRNMMATVNLAVVSLLLTLVISLPLGFWAAVKKNKISDYFIRMLSFVGISSPQFLTALVLVFVFATKLHWISVVGNGTSLVLPVATLTVGMSAKYIRQVRTCVLEELNKDYVIGARSRGVAPWRILGVHVLRNVMIPLLTLLAMSFGYLLGGAAVVEVIFSYPGLGSLIVTAVDYRDTMLIQGFVLWVALVFTLINMGTDSLFKVFDPRLRKEK